MSKNKNNEPSEAEDYLAQVEWQNKQFQRRTPLPWYMEPKWKFKRVASTRRAEKRISAPIMVLLVILSSCVGYFLYKNDVRLLIVFLVLGLFILLAIRDSSKRPKNHH